MPWSCRDLGMNLDAAFPGVSIVRRLASCSGGRTTIQEPFTIDGEDSNRRLINRNGWLAYIELKSIVYNNDRASRYCGLQWRCISGMTGLLEFLNSYQTTGGLNNQQF